MCSRILNIAVWVFALIFSLIALGSAATSSCPSDRTGPISASSQRLIYIPHDLQFVFTHHSLKKMLATISQKTGWKLIWNMPEDYHIYGNIKIDAPNVARAMQTLLKDQPLKATFYDKNRVVIISGRD